MGKFILCLLGQRVHYEKSVSFWTGFNQIGFGIELLKIGLVVNIIINYILFHSAFLKLEFVSYDYFRLSTDEYRQLTGNLIEVLDTHQQLLHLLEEEETKPSQDQRVGKLFLTWAPRMKSVHQAYCSLHPKAAFILDKYR